MEALDNPQNAGKAALSFLGDVIWTIFDAIKELVIAAWDGVAKLIAQALNIWTDPWKIPGLTRTFEIFAEQEFTLLNTVSFIAAGVLNMIFGRPAFEVLGDPSNIFANVTPESLDLHETLGIARPVGTPGEQYGATSHITKVIKTELAEKHQLKEDQENYNKAYDDYSVGGFPAIKPGPQLQFADEKCNLESIFPVRKHPKYHGQHRRLEP